MNNPLYNLFLALDWCNVNGWIFTNNMGFSSAYGRITLKTSQQLIAQLNAKSEELSEAQTLLADYENEIEQLTEALALEQQKADQERLGFEKELSALQALIEAGTKREIALQNQTETLRQTLHAAELKTAVAEALYQKNTLLS